LAKEKADLGKRLIAAVIDTLIAVVVSSIIPFRGIGSLIGGAYILVKDAQRHKKCAKGEYHEE
jgi:hypothetical protein